MKMANITVVYEKTKWAYQISPQFLCTTILSSAQETFGLGSYKVSDLQLYDAAEQLIDITLTVQAALQKYKTPFEIRVRQDTAVCFKLLYKHEGQSFSCDAVVRNDVDLGVILGNRDLYLIPIDKNGVPVTAQQIREYRLLDNKVRLYERCDGQDWLSQIAKFDSFVKNEGAAVEQSMVGSVIDWLTLQPAAEILQLRHGVHVFLNPPPVDEFYVVHGDSSNNKVGFECVKNALPSGCMARPKHEFDGFVFEKQSMILYVIEAKHAMLESRVLEHEKKLIDLAARLKENKVVVETNGQLLHLSNVSQLKGVVGGRYFPIAARIQAERTKLIFLVVNGLDFSVDVDSVKSSRNYML